MTAALPTRSELLAEIRAERLAWLLPWRRVPVVRVALPPRAPEPTVIYAKAEVIRTVPELGPANEAFLLAVAEAEEVDR